MKAGITRTEAIMRWFAKISGYEQDIDFWGIAGLLHDIDYEVYGG